MKIQFKIWFGIVIAILIILWFFNYRSGFKSEISDLNNTIEVKNKTVTYYEGANGKIIAQRDSYALTAKTAKKQAENLLKDNKGLEKKIKNYKNLVSHLEGQLKIKGGDTVHIIDTIIIKGDGTQVEAKKFTYNNSYLFLDGLIYNDTFDFSYTYTTSFSTTQYWKKQGLFKPKTLVVDFVLDDPSGKMTTAQSLYIKPSPKKFYEKNWFWGGVGFLGGILIAK